MDTMLNLNQHLRHHKNVPNNWAFLFLNLAALASLFTLFAGHFISSWPQQLIMTSIAVIVIFAGLFFTTQRFLYQRLINAVNEESSPADNNIRNNFDNGSHKLETLGRLAGGVAHDFNNSLFVLLNCIELMRTTEDTMTRQALLADMDSAAKGAQSTAMQLMSLSSGGSTPGQPSDPRSALRSVASNLRRMLPENITVKHELRGTPPVTLLSGQFEQIILNLCLNARDTMPEGGELTIRCYQNPAENNVNIEIIDTATVSPTAQLRMDESNIQDNLSQVGGVMEKKSLEGEGTCVTLKLPVADRLEQQNFDQPDISVNKNHRQHALLIDDNELVLTLLSTRLEQAGYITSTAESVEQAKILLDDKQAFDILICDAVLPDGTPRKVIDQFKESSQGPILICSGYEQNDPLLDDLQTESATFIQKPFSTDELVQQLNQISSQCA